MLYKTNNPHGGDIYENSIRLDFSANINPFGMPQRISDAIKTVLPELNKYPDPYCRRLVRAISEYEDVCEDYVLCGNGATELIYAYCTALHPSIAVETAPTFSEYSLALNRLGCQMERYELGQSTEFELDEGFIEYLKEKNPDVVFLCNPNNPTGRIISPNLLEKILCFCSQNNIHLFIDECFLDFTDDGVSMKNYLMQHPKLFILKAFTKNYGMAGVRLGYCMSSDTELLMRMSETVQPWNVSVIAQTAGIAALDEQEFLQKTRTFIARERIWLEKALEGLGLWVCPSEANYLLFHGPTVLDKELKKHGIAIRSCANFHGLSDGWYRIAVRLHGENEILIQAIKSICEKR